jgi:polyisoprenoid-binding protein YceI
MRSVTLWLSLLGTAWAQDPAPPSDQVDATLVSTLFTYDLQAAGSFLAVVVYKDPDTFLAGKAHDHALVASSFQGRVTWDTQDTGVCDVSLSFPVSSLTVDPGKARSRVGIDPDDTVGASGQGQLTANAMGESQLWASRFPQISFQSEACRAQGDRVTVDGSLTIRGAAKRVSVPMKVTASAEGFRAQGTFELTHKDFGFAPFSALGGMISNQERLGFVVDVVGVPVAP